MGVKIEFLNNVAKGESRAEIPNFITTFFCTNLNVATHSEERANEVSQW